MSIYECVEIVKPCEYGNALRTMLHTGPETDAPKHVLCHTCHRYRDCFRGPPLDPDAEATAYRMTWVEDEWGWILLLGVFRDATARASKWLCLTCVMRLVAAA